MQEQRAGEEESSVCDSAVRRSMLLHVNAIKLNVTN